MKRYDLADGIRRGLVFLDVRGNSPEQVIRQIVQRMKSCEEISDLDRLAEDAAFREQELSTALEGGVALPHARSRGVRRMVCAFARLVEPVDFGAPDARLTDLVFFTAIPLASVDEYLHFTAALVRRLAAPTVIDELRSAEDVDAVLATLGISP
jgi:PTS system fructose-specific IIC component